MSKLLITPYGGLGEIGMNCMLIETDTSAILIDCGLMFTELEHFGVEFIVPNFSHLYHKKEKIKAIFATHGHEDHIGALSFLIRAGIRAPIYSSHFTSLMIRERLAEVGLQDAVELNILHSGARLELQDFKITVVSVNHSIIDAFALFIDTPLGKVIHTGDFKLGQTAHLGDVMEWERFKKAGAEGVLLLLSDSTNVEVESEVTQEEEILPHFEKLFARATGLIVVSLFSSNVGRMANLFRIANKMGKKIAFTGRSMEQNIRLAQERGLITVEQGNVISLEEIKNYDRNKVLVLSTGCQGEPRSALNRIAQGDHAAIKLTPDDLVIFSSSQIPGNEKPISRLINELFQTGAEVIYNAVETVHSTGHATRPELKKMLEMVRPKFFIPIHGEYRHLVHHAELAFECGLKEEHILVAQNGDVVELTPDELQVVDQVHELRVMIESREGREISKSLLKERRRLAETGIVFLLLTREKDSGRILSRPQLIARGLVHESLESWLLDEAFLVVQQKIGEYKKELSRGYLNPNFSEDLRIVLRRFIEKITGKKPVVVPVLLDV